MILFNSFDFYLRHPKVRLAKQNIALYVMILPSLIYLILFCYIPMYGAQIAFRNYTFAKGITGSPFVGAKWFKYFFSSPQFSVVLKNTLIITIYSLAASFPLPIILALMLHNIPSGNYRKVVQTVTYLPHFISVVVLVGMMSCMFSIRSGFFNTLIEAIGGQTKYFMGEAQYFRHMYVWSEVWQNVGWDSIIYMAALTAVDPQLHEAAIIDGASKLQRIIYIDLPALTSTIVILLILRFGGMLSVGYEKVYLMQTDLNLTVSEVISTYTYKMGLVNSKYSYSTAIGLFNNVINFTLVVIVNRISLGLTGNSLW